MKRNFFIIKYNETQQLIHVHLIRVRRRRCEGQVWKAEIDWQEPESRKLLILAFNKKNLNKNFFQSFCDLNYNKYIIYFYFGYRLKARNLECAKESNSKT